MEYPFKDLMPLDEVLEREGYYKDWTHLDPEVFYSLTQISEYIKTKGYGVDVRLLIAQLAEHFGLTTTQVVDLASETVNVANDLTDRFNQQIGALTEDSEVIDARDGEVNLRAKLMTYEGAKRKTDDHVLLSDFGLDDAGVQACFEFAHQNKKGIIVDGMAEINTPKIIGKDILWIKGKSKKDSGFIPKGDFMGEPIFKATNYYTTPLKISNMTINAYHMTDTVRNGILVDYGGWGSCIQAIDMDFYYFTGYAVKIVDSYKCLFENITFQGKLDKTKTRSTTDWTSWIDYFSGTGVELVSVKSFSNVNTFNNVTFLKLKQATRLNKARLTVFNQCTFDQINLAFELRNDSEATLNSPWLEYVERVAINAKVDPITLSPITPHVDKSDIEQFKIYNARGIYLVPQGYELKQGEKSPITTPIVDTQINPNLAKYFTWESGLDTIPLRQYVSIPLTGSGYEGTIIVEPIHQRLNYVRGYFQVKNQTGVKSLNDLPFKSDGKVYAPVMKESDNSIAGYVRLVPYTAQNKSQVALDFVPQLNEKYNFNLTAQRIIV